MDPATRPFFDPRRQLDEPSISGRRRPARSFVVLLLATTTLGCQSPHYADRGAAVGGLTGAGVGAAIGNAHGDTAAGALIGTAVGALTGAAVGGGMDRAQAENRAYVEQRLADQRGQAATIQDAVVMSQAGLSDEVIISHLRGRGLQSLPTAGDLVALKNAGVSNNVLRAMQDLGSSGPVVPAAAFVPAAPPVVVQETFVQPIPVPVWGPRHCYPAWHPPHRHARRPPPGVSWGIEVHH
jgi:outer membrane lipoprotein SlyB